MLDMGSADMRGLVQIMTSTQLCRYLAEFGSCNAPSLFPACSHLSIESGLHERNDSNHGPLSGAITFIPVTGKDSTFKRQQKVPAGFTLNFLKKRIVDTLLYQGHFVLASTTLHPSGSSKVTAPVASQYGFSLFTFFTPNSSSFRTTPLTPGISNLRINTESRLSGRRVKSICLCFISGTRGEWRRWCGS